MYVFVHICMHMSVCMRDLAESDTRSHNIRVPPMHSHLAFGAFGVAGSKGGSSTGFTSPRPSSSSSLPAKSIMYRITGSYEPMDGPCTEKPTQASLLQPSYVSSRASLPKTR